MTIFISDTHLGTKKCKARKLLNFLTEQDLEEELVLVGDIIDNHCQMPWSPIDFLCLNRLLDFKKITYLPGNHDHFMNAVYGKFVRNNLLIAKYAVHKARSRKKYLVIHGDSFDWMMKYTKVFSASWFMKFGNERFTWLHTHMTGSPGSSFERAAVHEVKRLKLDGIICGHTHSPTIKRIDGVEFMNCGDWTQNCSALVEDEKTGEFKIYYFLFPSRGST